MSRICQVCGKEYLKGNQVSLGIGQRVRGRNIKKQLPNLRTKKIELGGNSMKIKICASCLKRLKFEEKREKAHAELKLQAENASHYA